MKQITPTTKKSVALLTILLASFLALQSLQAAAPGALPVVIPSISSDQAWQELQDKVANLNGNPLPEDLLGVEAQVIAYQSTLAQQNTGSKQSTADAIAAETELLHANLSNPLSLLFCAVMLENFENAVVNVREGSTTIKVNFFNDDTNSLLQEIGCDFAILQTDLLNVDVSNPAALEQVNTDVSNYQQAVKKLGAKAHHYKKAALRDAVDVAALTPEEQQLWKQFQSKLTRECNAICNHTLSQVPSSEGVINPVQLQKNFQQAEKINASAGALKILEQGCLYEFLNVLISKRSDTDSSLNSFQQLQRRLDQFLNNIAINNLVALLQAQVDMLAYEEEIASLAVAPTPAVVTE